MASPEGEDVYATLLLTDNYLPGALVLAHSLRDAGTTKKLAVLYTAETVSPEVVKELKSVFDYGIPVQRIKNDKPENLNLMNRPDLHSAFTKINLWKLTQFRKIVYIDADVLALRAPDELFDLPHPFSAAPDIGWPDIFNTGVMALTPNMGDYYALLAMADRGVSFDGADQGLLNMYFKDNYNRLSFTYNVTPSAHYQYLPAYQHFQSSINMVHFIGQDKPWFLGRNANTAGSPYSDMVGRWWSVYDKHYRVPSPAPSLESFRPGTQSTQQGSQPSQHGSKLLRYFVKGEFNPTDQAPGHSHWAPHAEAWDAQRRPPPAYSKPEAEDLPQEHYEMSQDTAPFVPPARYPSPPRNLRYVPTEPPAPFAEKPKAIFPWETHQPAASRTFWDNSYKSSGGDDEAPPGELSGLLGSQEPTEPSITGSSVTDPQSEPGTPSTPKVNPIQTGIWSSFDRTNAWDEVPEIQRYVQKLETHQRRKNQLRLGKIITSPSGEESPDKRRLRVTDFPSEHERPSLPVTPAPVRSKPKTWGGLGGGELPVAQGVPSQVDWVCSHGRIWAPDDCLCDLTNVLHYHKDPVVQLQKLAIQQSGVVVNDPKEPAGTEAPEDSPTVLSPQPVKGAAATNIVRGMLGNADSRAPGAIGMPQTSRIPEQSYMGLGAAWEKREDVPAHMVSVYGTDTTDEDIDAFQI